MPRHLHNLAYRSSIQCSYHRHTYHKTIMCVSCKLPIGHNTVAMQSQHTELHSARDESFEGHTHPLTRGQKHRELASVCLWLDEREMRALHALFFGQKVSRRRRIYLCTCALRSYAFGQRFCIHRARESDAVASRREETGRCCCCFACSLANIGAVVVELETTTRKLVEVCVCMRSVQFIWRAHRKRATNERIEICCDSSAKLKLLHT